MPRGGSRPGERRGGRAKGTKNKKTRLREQEFEQVVAAGELPRDYMLRVMRDENADPERRDRMAMAVARYIHPTLSSVKHSGDLNINEMNADELRASIARDLKELGLEVLAAALADGSAAAGTKPN